MPIQNVSMFSPVGVASTTLMTVTPTSGTFTISPAPAIPYQATIRVLNMGAVPAYVALGGTGLAAVGTGTAVSLPMMGAGPPEVFSVGGNPYFAAVTLAGTTTLAITPGNGS